MAPLAKQLSIYRGVLEPLQTADSVSGQVDELYAMLQQHGDLPVILIGHSWGAWLSFMVAAAYPEPVKKLILIGSGPFEASYAGEIMPVRFSRLNQAERLRAETLMAALQESNHPAENEILAEFGQLMSKTDSFCPVAEEVGSQGEFQANIYRSVWLEAEAMRQSGELLKLGKKIGCPVVAIHGDYDPHPAAGVERPLLEIIKDFRFILLKDCGHEPWKERLARDRFYETLNGELENQ
jgi:pimeloyl-ACP methyl ester carboxylesterase